MPSVKSRSANLRDPPRSRAGDSHTSNTSTSTTHRYRRDRSRSRRDARESGSYSTSSHRNERGGSGHHHSSNVTSSRDFGVSKRSHHSRDASSHERGSKKRPRDAVKEKSSTKETKKSSKRAKSKSSSDTERPKKSNESDGMPFLLPAYVAKIAGSVLTPYHLALQNRIYVGNIPTHVTDDQLRMEFTRFGGVANVAMAWDEERRRSHGWCFIDFEEPKGAADVLKTAPGVLHIGGKAVRISPPNNPLGATRPPRTMTAEEAYLLTVARIIEPAGMASRGSGNMPHPHAMSPPLPGGVGHPSIGMHNAGGGQYYGAPPFPT